MKKLLENWDWEDSWYALLWATCASLVTIVIILIVVPKPTLRYSLGDDSGKLSIIREIEWCDDDVILLDRNVTYSEAIKMVDSLNKTLK